jgi:CHAT domain-containing protein
VTAGKVNLVSLPGEEELTSKANSFAAAVRTGHDASSAAAGLTKALFSGLPADVWNRSEWMIVADGPLLSGIPFCALPDLSAKKGKLLIEDRSLRFLPSELLLATGRQRPANGKRFVGVGDPIYNQADARIVRTGFSDAKTVSDSITLARLAGSDKEIHSAAKEARLPDAVLLTGSQATRENLAAALSKESEIVHFAVHVVSPADQPQEAALALSIKNGVPELLTPEVVASFHVPGSLVVLSGCSSGQGKVLPGAGLVGLSRAWLLAGAEAVVVSSWPTPDDSGKFFSSFYGHFDQIATGDTAQRAALALRRTQLDMMHGTGYQTSPSFWGAFAVISKE